MRGRSSLFLDRRKKKQATLARLPAFLKWIFSQEELPSTSGFVCSLVRLSYCIVELPPEVLEFVVIYCMILVELLDQSSFSLVRQTVELIAEGSASLSEVRPLVAQSVAKIDHGGIVRDGAVARTIVLEIMESVTDVPRGLMVLLDEIQVVGTKLHPHCPNFVHSRIVKIVEQIA